jgi:hypothetical protein
LVSEEAGEINLVFDSLLLANGRQHICLPKGEHYSLGVPEKATRSLKATWTEIIELSDG